MTDNISDPTNPSSPSQPRRPRRPNISRQDSPQGNKPDESKPEIVGNKSSQNPNSRRNNNQPNPTGWVKNKTGATKPRTDDRKNSQNNSNRAFPNGNRRQSINGTRKKPFDKRINGENNSEEIPVRLPSIPLKAVGGIKALAENGQFGRNWWARRWIKAMERLMDGRRLSRGQDYASQGQVLSMGEIKNGVAATVQGSRIKPYRVTIQVMPLKTEEWERALDVLASQAVFAAKLLAGEMPENIEEAFQSAKLSLFPERPGDLVTQCSCPDWANPCKHVAAAHYILGDRFDEDPFLLFRMRGRSQEQVLEGLRVHRGGTADEVVSSVAEESTTPLDSNLNSFWESGDELSGFSVQIKMPKVVLPILKRLGQPEIIRTFLLEDELGPAYESASQAAMILAYSDTTGPTGDTTPETDSEEEN
jgi:uncharacterized Zn finger protein